MCSTDNVCRVDLPLLESRNILQTLLANQYQITLQCCSNSSLIMRGDVDKWGDESGSTAVVNVHGIMQP